MARNFYKKDGSYYYSDNNQKILNVPELQAAARAGGKETTPPQQIETQESVDAKYKEAASKNPAIQALTKGGSTVDQIIIGLQTGNLSGLNMASGQPFSVADQQAALSQANEDNKLYYEALKAKETADTEAALAKKQADYQDYLISAGEQFKADKTTLDQNAANQGVLFSGGRAQKENRLQQSYAQDQATKLRNLSSDVASTANDYQYKYGNDAASNLSKYYSAGGNTYNANVAQGGVGSAGLSNVYSASPYNFQGTRNTERSAAANTRAAGLLWNKGNKLLASGYANQY
jgi:hypothetical protein